MSLAATSAACGLENLFWFEEAEGSYELGAGQGAIPSWLRGTWYINGPARFERSGMRYRHWLDGDGMVCALQFSGDGLRFTSRFVRTRKLQDEAAAGRFLYRGFGSAFPGARLRRNLMLEPPVNVSVYPYAGRLLAFGEQAMPYELDPDTLETRGEYDFGGSINEVTPFAAHPKMDGGLVNFGISFSAERPALHVYEFDGAGAMLRRRRYPLPHPYSLHDFGLTPRHAAFFLSPLLMDFAEFWNGGASVLDSLIWRPELGAQILIAPRIGCGEDPFTVEAGAGYCLHVINCFETAGRLVLDVLLLDQPVYPSYQPLPRLFATPPRGRPARYIVDLASRKLVAARAAELGRCPDFPAVDPRCAGRAETGFWMLDMSTPETSGGNFFNQVVHVAPDTDGAGDGFQAGPGEYFCGEPVFVPDPRRGTGEAVVITEHLQPLRRSASIVLFDAFAVRQGPLATIPLRCPVHPGFHASFAPLS